MRNELHYTKEFKSSSIKKTCMGRRLSQSSSLDNGLTVLQLPFTSIVAGCTLRGKTVYVTKLLEYAKTTISPPPERIVWCYGQWQLMYFEMIKNIPCIEFNKDIPSDITPVNFWIVLADRMTWSGGERRITDIFTKGIHCRNLTVIYIVRNKFHKGLKKQCPSYPPGISATPKANPF